MFAYMSSDDADDDAKRRQTKVWAEGKGCNQFELILSLGNLTLQWKIHYVQVHFLFGTCGFHCCVRLLEVPWKLNLISRVLCMATPLLPRRIFLLAIGRLQSPNFLSRWKKLLITPLVWMLEWQYLTSSKRQLLKPRNSQRITGL